MAGYATIDNVAVKQIASNIIRENVVQDVIVIPQKAADFRYAEDLDGENITVQRTKMGSQSGRIIQTGLNNGGFLNSKKNNIESDLATIPLTLVYDAPTDVPQNALNLNGSGRLLESILMNTTKAISRFINLIQKERRPLFVYAFLFLLNLVYCIICNNLVSQVHHIIINRFVFFTYIHRKSPPAHFM